MNHVIGYAELLQEELIPGLKQIQAAGQQLLALINRNLNPAELGKGNLSSPRLDSELCAPINAIVGLSEALQEEVRGRDQEALLPDLQNIRAAALLLLAGIADVSALSAPEPGKTVPPLKNHPSAGGSWEVGSSLQSSGEVKDQNLGVEEGLLLVVDDNELNRDMLARHLERQGHMVAVAQDGHGALEIIKANSVDLVLLDILMPEIDGYQVLEYLKSDHALRDIPVIMVSALEEMDGVLKCIEMGAEDYLPKPFDPVLMKARVGACLKRRRLEVSQRKQLQEQFLQAQKMESIGQLASGVAHDFNNLLIPIMGHVYLGTKALPSDYPTRSNLEEINKAAERASGLTKQLLAFSRRQKIEPQVINLNDLITDMDKMLRRLIGEDIELVTLNSPGLDLVKVVPGQFEQVIMNLVVNSRDAMPHGGRISIETLNALDGASTCQHPDGSLGPHVTLSVSDTGTGMPEEVKAHVFEHFFTTKEEGKGTGLGLSTCYGIVQQSGGHMVVNSEPDQGTTFRICLPRSRETEDPRQSIGEETCLSKGTETVLLAEDEPVVRNLIATILGEQGYDVLQATNGDEALHVARAHASEEIHLLLTDVVMPHLNGVEMAKRLRNTHPNARVLFISGYSDDAIIHDTEFDNVAFLQKPFSTFELTRKMRDVLDR